MKMTDTAVAEKVDRLEELVMLIAYEHTKTEMELRNLSKEMKAFKDEMHVFKDEMKDYKDDTQVFKDEMRAFKDEMKASKKENDRCWGTWSISWVPC
jgi:chromosome segregation ATPase